MSLFQNLGTCFWPPLVYNLQMDPSNVNHTTAMEARLACLFFEYARHSAASGPSHLLSPPSGDAFYQLFTQLIASLPPDVSKSDFLTTLVKISFLYTPHPALISPQCRSVTADPCMSLYPLFVCVPRCAVPPGRC